VPLQALEAFFATRPERFLNRLFISGSAKTRETGRMTYPPRLLHATAPGTVRPAFTSRRAAWLLAACALWAASLARADEGDHVRARDAVQSGQALALPELLERLQRTHPGQVLEIELERDDGRWVYEVKLLQPGGQVVKLAVDARTAEVLKQRPKGPPPTQGPAR
jgi:uncharacterized membrane protein YkoI